MRNDRPIIHGDDHAGFGSDAILDKNWITVGGGTPAPNFESPWSGDVDFIMAVGGWTVARGMPTGGAAGDTVFFLPERYWPPADEYQISHGATVGDISFWKVQSSDGAVIYEGSRSGLAGGGGTSIVASIAKSGDAPIVGTVTLSAGTGITLTQAGQDIQISGGTAIVTSIAKSGDAPILGTVTFSAGSGITLTQTGHDIQISGTAGASSSSSAAGALFLYANFV